MTLEEERLNLECYINSIENKIENVYVNEKFPSVLKLYENREILTDIEEHNKIYTILLKLNLYLQRDLTNLKGLRIFYFRNFRKHHFKKLSHDNLLFEINLDTFCFSFYFIDILENLKIKINDNYVSFYVFDINNKLVKNLRNFPFFLNITWKSFKIILYDIELKEEDVITFEANFITISYDEKQKLSKFSIIEDEETNYFF